MDELWLHNLQKLERTGEVEQRKHHDMNQEEQVENIKKSQ